MIIELQKAYSYCIIPVAGSSSRMNGKWKAILPWKDSTILGTVVKTVLDCSCHTLLVAGYCHEQIYTNFGKKENVEIIYNENWQSGRLSSLKAAVSHFLKSNTDNKYAGFFVLNGDMPLVEGKTLEIVKNKFVSELQKTGISKVVFPEIAGKVGHPVWIPSYLCTKILALDNTVPFRTFLQSKSWTSVKVLDEGILFDIDTEEDYLRKK